MWRPIGAAMSLGRPRQVVFFVCHPDDEALWVGGLVSGLGRFGVEVSVICASGGGQGSVRAAEFQSAREGAGYKRGLVLGGPLRAANEPLPPLALTLEAGLTQLGIDPSEVALLVTHSPYGDEHRHPHHKQAYQELKQWAQGSRVPFGFFSCMPLPWLQHQPIAASLRRAHGLSLIGVFECRPAVQSAAMIDGGGGTNTAGKPRPYFSFGFLGAGQGTHARPLSLDRPREARHRLRYVRRVFRSAVCFRRKRRCRTVRLISTNGPFGCGRPVCRNMLSCGGTRSLRMVATHAESRARLRHTCHIS